MRLVYLHQYFTTPDMAGGTRSYEMARRLVAAGHEVHMVTSARDPAEGRTSWYRTEVDGIQVHWLPVAYSNRMGFVARMRAFIAFAKAAGARAKSLKPDLVFATSTPLTIAIPAVRAARACGAPLVFEVRDLWPEMPIAAGALRNPALIMAAKRLERWAYRNSARVVALSPGMQAGIVKTGYPEAKTVVIPNSCDLGLFRPDPALGQALRRRHDWLGDRPMVAYVGTLGYLNGVHYLVAVAKAMQQIDGQVQFAVVGAGAEEDRIREEARAAGVLGKTFHLMPPVPKRDVPAWLSAAAVVTSLFLPIPEMQANSANKFFDGLAAGRPVAINYGGWMADLVTTHRTGVVLHQDASLAARQLADLLANPGRLQACAIAARRLAVEQFDRDVLAERLQQVLLEAHAEATASSGQAAAREARP